MIKTYKNISPDIKKAAFVADSADVIGDVKLGSNASVWYSAVLRGDSGPIVIGKNSNVQDNCTIHCSISGYNVTIGENVTIGHNAIIHGCTIGDNCLIGMGSVILDGAVINKNCVVGAGSLITQHKEFPEGSLILGSPAKVVRTLEEKDINGIKENADEYVMLAHEHNNEKTRVLPL